MPGLPLTRMQYYLDGHNTARIDCGVDVGLPRPTCLRRLKNHLDCPSRGSSPLWIDSLIPCYLPGSTWSHSLPDATLPGFTLTQMQCCLASLLLGSYPDSFRPGLSLTRTQYHQYPLWLACSTTRTDSYLQQSYLGPWARPLSQAGASYGTLAVRRPSPYSGPYGRHHPQRVGPPPPPLLLPIPMRSATLRTLPPLAPAAGACAAAGAGGGCGGSPTTGRIKAKKPQGRFITNACSTKFRGLVLTAGCKCEGSQTAA